DRSTRCHQASIFSHSTSSVENLLFLGAHPKHVNFLQPRRETPEGSYTIWGAWNWENFTCQGESVASTFLHVFGSELIQKYLGDGPKLVRELFRVADEPSPSIVFIDEIEALGRPLVLTPCCIGISPVYRAIFQPFSHIISKR
ncbi:unnamed protein product, partial [Musa banksii]